MNKYISIGSPSFVDYPVLLTRVALIQKYYQYLMGGIDKTYFNSNPTEEIIIKVHTYLDGSYSLKYETRRYYESDEWTDISGEESISITPYNVWLSSIDHSKLEFDFFKESTEEENDIPENDESNNDHHYIYLLKDDLSFALMTMSSEIGDDYITLLDYSDILDVNTYTADFLLNSVSSAFDMDKFYQIPVKNSDHATINDVFDFLKKEK